MIFFVIGLVIIAAVMEYRSLYHGTDKLSMKTSFGRRVVEPDEIFPMNTTVENSGRMMIPYLKVSETVPGCMTVQDGEEYFEQLYGNQGGRELTYTGYLAGRQRLELSRNVSVSRRGRYSYFESVLYAGDFLGVSGEGKKFPCGGEIIVKPRAARSRALSDSLGGYLGELSVRRFWIEDPMFLVGYREYTGREPMRAISWTMTAKTGGMMVKEYDHTAERTCAVICDISTRDLRRLRSRDQESIFSITRTVCEELEAKGVSYSFLTNASVSGAEHALIEYPSGMGAGHLEAVLEILGSANGYYTRHLEALLDRTLASASALRACVIISMEESGECTALIEELSRRTGAKTLVLTPDILDEEGRREAAS